MKINLVIIALLFSTYNCYAQKIKIKCLPFRATTAYSLSEETFENLSNSSVKNYTIINRKLRKNITNAFNGLVNKSSLAQRSETDVRVRINIIISNDTTKIYFNKDGTFLYKDQKYKSANKDILYFFKVLNKNKCSCDFNGIFLFD